MVRGRSIYIQQIRYLVFRTADPIYESPSAMPVVCLTIDRWARRILSLHMSIATSVRWVDKPGGLERGSADQRTTNKHHKQHHHDNMIIYTRYISDDIQQTTGEMATP